MADSARQALSILRDASQFNWYVIPLLSLVVYAYAVEVEKRNWNMVFAGLTYLGLDLFIEICNSLVFHFSGFAPVWGAPGRTAYLIMVGLNIEICFMFAIVGLTMAKFLPEDRGLKVLGIPNRLFVGLCSAFICVFVEFLLNSIGALTWEYPWWNAGAPLLLIVGGYCSFFLISFWVHDMETVRRKIITVGLIFAMDISCAVVFGGFLGWL